MFCGRWSVLLSGLLGLLAIPDANAFSESTTCTSDLVQNTCTPTQTFTSLDASPTKALPDEFFSGMFKDLNTLLSAHDSARLKHYSRPTSYSLSQALIEDAMDRLLPSFRIRTLISLLDLGALVADDEDVDPTLSITVDFSGPDVEAQMAKVQSLYAAKRDRGIVLEGRNCDEVCSLRSEISRCLTGDCLCDEEDVKELGKCTYCVTESVKSERFTAEAEDIFADILTLCEGYRRKQ